MEREAATELELYDPSDASELELYDDNDTADDDDASEARKLGSFGSTPADEAAAPIELEVE